MPPLVLFVDVLPIIVHLGGAPLEANFICQVCSSMFGDMNIYLPEFSVRVFGAGACLVGLVEELEGKDARRGSLKEKTHFVKNFSEEMCFSCACLTCVPPSVCMVLQALAQLTKFAKRMATVPN